jgi:hypothetical protein
MKYITILCDFKYIHYAVALIQSLPATNLYVINFLCLDDKTYNTISKFQHVKCYREVIFVNNKALLNLKQTEYKYYLWSLASIFSDYIMVNNIDCESVLYIDSDIIFHKDIGILYDSFGEKDVGIFRHRFLNDNVMNCPYGKFNVGVVYFKNSEKGKEVLSWWADAVLYKKYPQLATCGDQRYLDHFPFMCTSNQLFIDGNIGHGAPWNWSQYSLDNIHTHKIIFRGNEQELIFSHFSKFQFSFKDNTYGENFYTPYTNNNKIYENKSLMLLHREYFLNLKNADEFIKNNEDIKIAVGIIVFESDYVLKQCIEQIYPFVEQIVISEGPVKFWQDRGKKTSEDKTNIILDNFPDPDKKINIIHGQYTEKLDESNAYIKFIRNDIDYLWQIDADELYRNEDIIKIKNLLKKERPTSVGVQSCSFYGGFDRHLTGFELKRDNFLRIFKYMPGCKWESHRPPTIKYPEPITRKHINSDELYKKYGVQMYHYSYVFPKQVLTKTMYYSTFVQNGNIPNYFVNVYLTWINSDDNGKYEIEKKYRGVHEWIPDRRGDCYTRPFTELHPESIIKDIDILKERFNKEKNN